MCVVPWRNFIFEYSRPYNETDKDVGDTDLVPDHVPSVKCIKTLLTIIFIFSTMINHLEYMVHNELCLFEIRFLQ